MEAWAIQLIDNKSMNAGNNNDIKNKRMYYHE